MMRILPGLLVTLCMCNCNCSSPKQDAESVAETVRNPVVDFGSDPWVIRNGDTFHYCYSKAIYVKSVEKLSELNTAVAHMLCKAPDTGPYSKEIWAPELHRFGDKWYVYFCIG